MASSSKERQITCYPHPVYSELIRAYAKVKNISQSEAGAIAIKHLIDSLPAAEKERLNQVAKKKPSKNSY